MSQFWLNNNSSGGSTIDTITGNTGGAVGPDSSDNINLVGTGGVSVAGNPGTNTLTISASGGGITWTDEATSFSAAASNGYFVTGNATAILPASPAQGDVCAFNCVAGITLTIRANTGQFIAASTATSSSGGTCINTAKGDAITLFYRAASSTWQAQSMVGMFAFA
jgi:hypothetical protein